MKYMISRAALCVALAMMMLFATLPVSAAPSVQVAIADVGAAPGSTVTVPVAFSQVDDLTGVELHLQYDTSRLEFVEGKPSSFVGDMGMASAAASGMNEVWLSAMALDGVSGSGEAFLLTFRVKEDAPEGLAVIDFAAYEHMLLVGTDMTESALTLVEGGVKVAGQVAPSAQTTTPTDVPLPEETYAVTDEAGQAITRVDGQTVMLAPAATVVDLKGAIVTDANGDPLRLPSVAVMVDQLTAEPEEDVTVQVSLSAVAELSSLEIGITYNTAALTFVGGKGCGFVGEALRVRETEGGLLLQAEKASHFSGSGAVAELTFRVKDTAYKGNYRLGLDPEPRLMRDELTVLTVQPFAGEIRVLSDGANAGREDNGWIRWLVGGIAAVAAIGGVVWFIGMRATSASEKKRPPKAPRTTDVSGDE